ncbi:MAG: hypothetical protein H6658_02500 [Ardenticatenaceae bacterium]|nr:hypothetical protein [Ardenticatenaceae bacterium]
MNGLWAKWRQVLGPFAVEDAVAERVFADLVLCYGEDGRFYHNLSHIQNVLQVVDSLQACVGDYTAVQLAAWFHDVVYHMQLGAGQPSNEQQSAAYAAQTLATLHVPAAAIDLVQQLICATQLNAVAPDDPNFHVLLDADLATLAAAEAVYDQYAGAIRQEYGFVPDEAYRNGRAQVLQSFLDRERIFRTDVMYAQCEEAARQNIQREMKQLLAGSEP